MKDIRQLENYNKMSRFTREPDDEISDELKAAYTKFKIQRRLCSEVWELSFTDWLDLWLKSGKWSQRGRKKGQYVLARINKNRTFNIENIHIVKQIENMS